MAGKGDSPRPVDLKRYGENFDRVFGTNCNVYKCGNPDLCPKCQAEQNAALKRLPTPDQITRIIGPEHYGKPGEFQKFPKIPRLYRDIIITEKIDGANAQIFVPKDPAQPLWAGSRKRWITPEDDNFGFAAWVKDHEDELRQLGPGHHFGEWWGKGIQRKYGLDHRRFSLFNVSRWKILHMVDYWLDPSEEDKRQLTPACCHVVPILYLGMFESSEIDCVLHSLREDGSMAVPGFMKPEGIVIFHRQSGHLFKVTLENDEKPKGKQK